MATTKNDLIRINAELAAEAAALRAEVSRLTLLNNMKVVDKVAEQIKAKAPTKLQSKVLTVKERVYATAAEAKAAYNRCVEWAKTHEAKVSLSGCKVYVKTPA